MDSDHFLKTAGYALLQVIHKNNPESRFIVSEVKLRGYHIIEFYNMCAPVSVRELERVLPTRTIQVVPISSSTSSIQILISRTETNARAASVSFNDFMFKLMVAVSTACGVAITWRYIA